MSKRLNTLALVAFLAACFCLTACGGRIVLRPGRDAYYQVTTQVVPAQSSGSHSQSASLQTSGVEGDYLPAAPATLVNTAPLR